MLVLAACSKAVRPRRLPMAAVYVRQKLAPLPSKAEVICWVHLYVYRADARGRSLQVAGLLLAMPDEVW